MTGTLTIDTGSSSSDALVIRGTSPTISFIDEGSADDFYIHVNSNNFYVLRDTAGSDLVGTGWDSPHPLQLEGDTNIGYLFGNVMWHAGNDGSGSGLDADLLDGVQGSSYLRSDQSDTLNGYLTIQTASGNGTFGPSNTGWFHMNTDRPSFYMNKGLRVAGTLGVYNQNTYLTSDDLYLNGQIFHYGDTNTYMQFHASDQWRVVTGGTERLEVNNNGVNIKGHLYSNDKKTIVGSTLSQGTASGISSLTFSVDSPSTDGSYSVYRLRIHSLTPERYGILWAGRDGNYWWGNQTARLSYNAPGSTGDEAFNNTNIQWGSSSAFSRYSYLTVPNGYYDVPTELEVYFYVTKYSVYNQEIQAHVHGSGANHLSGYSTILSESGFNSQIDFDQITLWPYSGNFGRLEYYFDYIGTFSP
jgi:hypothetical protein